METWSQTKFEYNILYTVEPLNKEHFGTTQPFCPLLSSSQRSKKVLLLWTLRTILFSEGTLSEVPLKSVWASYASHTWDWWESNSVMLRSGVLGDNCRYWCSPWRIKQYCESVAIAVGVYLLVNFEEEMNVCSIYGLLVNCRWPLKDQHFLFRGNLFPGTVPELPGQWSLVWCTLSRDNYLLL